MAYWLRLWKHTACAECLDFLSGVWVLELSYMLSRGCLYVEQQSPEYWMSLVGSALWMCGGNSLHHQWRRYIIPIGGSLQLVPRRLLISWFSFANFSPCSSLINHKYVHDNMWRPSPPCESRNVDMLWTLTYSYTSPSPSSGPSIPFLLCPSVSDLFTYCQTF